MTKVLQKKFIITAMLAVTILILLMMGMMNIVNYWSINRQLHKTLVKIAESADGLPPKDKFPFLDMPMGEESLLGAKYFLVRFDAQGNIVYADVSKIDFLTKEEAEEKAMRILESGETGGRAGHYEYLIKKTRDGRGTVVVCIYTLSQLGSILRVLVISIAIGLISWLLMLVLVIVLSKRAIMPIAQNIERQRQFVTNAGHEIKTPLAIILANTEAMELHQGISKWSRNIRTQTIRLDGLMKNLLMLSRMDEGAAQSEAADFDVSTLFEDTLDTYREPAALRGIQIFESIIPEIVLHADKENICRLFNLLLDNAVKYTDSGGQIHVSLKKEDKAVVIQIKNTCENLPEAPPQQLFERFYRADGARTQKSGGYGIGLSAAQAIVKAEQGKIAAAYENDNEIIFTVRF